MKTARELPSFETLDELFEYNPETGLLYNKTDRAKSVKKGSVVGNRTQRYKTCYVGGKHYTQHRVIWKLQTGHDPFGEIDHINRDSFDNRWENLRDVDRSGNCLNVGTRKDNALGEKGIHFCNIRSRFVVQIQRNKKRVQKVFKTLEEAVGFRDEGYRP